MQLDNVTVFGGSGFVGRYVVKRLADQGRRVRVAVRDPERAAFLKPMGDVGQVVPIQANVRNAASVRRAVEGAGAVINLTGLLYQSGAQRFDAVHVAGAENIARAAVDAGASRLVHMSAIGADAASDSHYAQTKAAGEAAVRAACPDACIVRPSIVFGAEDGFFNLFGWLATIAPALPLPGDGGTRFQPVYVGDVASAIVRLLDDPAAAGKTYELGGPQVLTFRDLMQIVLAQTGRKSLLVPVPFALMKMKAAFLQLMPKPLMTMDQVELLKSDNVVSDGAPGLADLGIQPTALDAILPTYMARYRRHGHLEPSQA
jgi:uncharacterized protein YbjT (DUF2867 family)